MLLSSFIFLKIIWKKLEQMKKRYFNMNKT